LKKQRANTLQERFGFADDDLKKPKHDEILLWLDKRAEEFIKEIISWTKVWPAQFVERKVEAVTRALKTRADSLRESIARFNNEQYRKALALIDSYEGLGEPPPREFRMRKIWEDAVTNVGATKYVVGFLDMVVLVDNSELGVDDESQRLPKWYVTNCAQEGFGFEAKTAIPSLGELIRQLRLYQQYCRYQLYVVSPDDGFAEQLVEQGFGFIKYPDGTIQRPAAATRH